MRTIIQNFPRIYGEAVNGSVFGQPNGSIARPPQNVGASITLSGTVTLTFVRNAGPTTAQYSISGLAVAYNFPSKFSVCRLEITDTNDDVVASTFITNADYIPDFTMGYVNGPLSEKPADGDTLSLTISAKDSDGNVIATDTIAATAEVPA